MLVIGLTGGSGSGKTTFLKTLESRDALIIDCDKVYHQLLESDAALLHDIDTEFPGFVVAGKLDRKKLGAHVFASPDRLAQLNAITHRYVDIEVKRLMAESSSALVAIDAIALIESGLSGLCDYTIAAITPPDVRIDRLVKRDGITREYAESRIAAQKQDSWYEANVDYAISNTGTESEFTIKCNELLDRLLYSA